MKNIFFLVFIALISCETDRIIFKGPYFVRFTETSSTVKESYPFVINLEVHNAGTVLDHDININYKVTGDAREGIDYEIIGTKGKVVIPKNKYFGNIQIKLINNSNNIIRSQDMILTLTSASDRVVGQGDGGIGSQYTLNIEDDCLLGGYYAGTQNVLSVPVADIKITSNDCDNYLLSNWDVNIFGAADPVPLTFKDNGDNSLTIPKQQRSVNFGFYSIDIELNGVGSVNPVTRQIFMSISFNDGQNDYQANINLNPE